jgi:nucleoside-diphosphate-sugar epimerase
MKKIFITGGAGFFGSKLVEKFLERGDKVTVYDNLQFGNDGVKPFIDNKNYNLIVGDVRDTQNMLNSIGDSDIVIHLAAYVGEVICKENINFVDEVNTFSSVELSKFCDKNNREFLFLSTCSNYGKTDIVVDEKSELNPSGLYSTSKIVAEKQIIEESNSYLILRCATLFGVSHRMRVDLTINQLMYEMYRDGIVTVYGEDAWRPYVHVEDACNMILLSLDSKLKGVYNLGDDTLNYTKKQIIDALKFNNNFIVKPIVWDDPRDYKVNFSKIKNSIQYQIKYNLNDGVKELMEHMNTIEFKNKQNIKNNRHV